MPVPASVFLRLLRKVALHFERNEEHLPKELYQKYLEEVIGSLSEKLKEDYDLTSRALSCLACFCQ